MTRKQHEPAEIKKFDFRIIVINSGVAMQLDNSGKGHIHLFVFCNLLISFKIDFF